MNARTRLIAIGALLTALSFVALYFASILPTGQLGFAALAALFGIAAVIETGSKGGVAVYICTLALGLLLCADKAPAAIYGLFFGYYPILKSFAERRRSRVAEWVIKLAVMNAALTVVIFLFQKLVWTPPFWHDSPVILYAAANIVFVIFDIGVTKATGFYIGTIRKRRGGL